MAKYIDADKAKNGIYEFVDKYGEITGMFITDFNILLERCAADVAEVRHGKWIWDDEGFHCTECFYHAYGNTVEITDGEWHYCPNCGVSMEGEE